MDPTFRARVIKILGRVTAPGMFTVRVERLDFPRTQFLCNVKGPVRVRDVIRLSEEGLQIKQTPFEPKTDII